MRCNQFCAKKNKTFTILRCIFYIAVFNQIMTKRNIEGGVISEAIFKLVPFLNKCIKSLFSTFHFSTCAQKCWKAADFKYSKNWEPLFCKFGWGWDQIWTPIETRTATAPVAVLGLAIHFIWTGLVWQLYTNRKQRHDCLLAQILNNYLSLLYFLK